MDDAALPRLLYVGDVSVADTMAGEALLFRLLQFYPAGKLALICGTRPGMPVLPGVRYHHWGPAFPRLLHSRVSEEYVLWRAWRLRSNYLWLFALAWAGPITLACSRIGNSFGLVGYSFLVDNSTLLAMASVLVAQIRSKEANRLQPIAY